ncbi:MAG: PHP domain-containing protein [Patescibacteria group bacterium]
MDKKKFFTPIVRNEKIGAEIKLSEEEKKNRVEKRSGQNSLSKYILKWWRGDAHTHSKESTREGFCYPEGIYDIQEIMKYYQELGLEFTCFTEHASNPGTPEKQALDSEILNSIIAEMYKIEKINKEKKLTIIALSGVETNIFYDKDDKIILDVPDEILQKLDLVIASRHALPSELEKKPEEIQKTLMVAIKNKNVDVIGHPDRYTRLDGQQSKKYWKKYWKIWPKILQEMKSNNKAFEINLNNPPSKKLIELAVKKGLVFFINYDAHDFNQYKKDGNDSVKQCEPIKRKWSKNNINKDDLKILQNYKENRLSSGPGIKAILKLVKQIKFLELLGVTPDKIINSSKKNLLNFLTKKKEKTTLNLKYLIEKNEK